MSYLTFNNDTQTHRIMLNTVNQRLKFFVDSLHVSATSFGTDIGTSQSAISQILTGKRPLSPGMLGRIKARHPKLNVKWLLTGEGDMIEDTPKGGVNQYVGRDGNNYNNSPTFAENIDEIDKQIVELTVNSAPKDLMSEIHRLKALLFDRDEEIKKLKSDIEKKKKEIKALKEKLK